MMTLPPPPRPPTSPRSLRVAATRNDGSHQEGGMNSNRSPPTAPPILNWFVWVDRWFSHWFRSIHAT
jgi:hypothetical protein